MTVVTDVTDRDNALAETEQCGVRYRQIVETAKEGILTIDTDMAISSANQHAADLLGYPIDQLVGHPLAQFSGGDRRDSAQARAVRQIEARQTGERETTLRRSGTIVSVLLNESPLLDKAGHYAGQLGMITDLTERNGLEHELAFRGVHDPLTGLPNRLLLVDRLELALGRATPGAGAVAVACVDVDAFKEVNTAYGHDGGDQILVEMAARLTGTIGAGDTVARFGGDESVVICEGRGPFAERLAERISAVISTPYAVGESHIDITARVGVAVGLQGVLEITEGVLMDDVQHSVSALGALRQTGVTIAIDDFGTGYSSLSYLQPFPIDALKIDQSFVAGLPENDYDMALVRAVMAISGALNRSVIAEGVESEEQATALLQMGCKGSRATTSIDR